MAEVQKKVGRTESLVGGLILITLAGIFTGIVVRQIQYERKKIPSPREEGSSPGPRSIAQGINLDPCLPQEALFISPLENFGEENLADKINGKAELYLSSGFRSLECRRFSPRNDPKLWMECFVYDMGSLRHSFAVYSGQKRSDAESLSLTPFSYKTQNAIYFAHGPYYVEIVASVDSEEALRLMELFARDLVQKTPVPNEKIEEFSIFPEEDRTQEGIMLNMSNAFGFEHFDRVFAANYNLEEQEVMAFLSLRKDEKEAQKLAEAYYKFLLANGGNNDKIEIPIPHAKIVNLMGVYEIVFHEGKFIAGVRNSESKTASARLAQIVYQRIKEGRQ